MDELTQLHQNFHRCLWYNDTVVPAEVAEEGASIKLEEGDATPIFPDEPHGVILHNWASLQVSLNWSHTNR